MIQVVDVLMILIQGSDDMSWRWTSLTDQLLDFLELGWYGSIMTQDDIDFDSALIQVVDDWCGCYEVTKNDAADGLKEIREAIKLLMEKAKDIVDAFGSENDGGVMKGYWYAHIVRALDKDHEYLGGSMMTMQDTIDSMEGGDKDENESD